MANDIIPIRGKPLSPSSGNVANVDVFAENSQRRQPSLRGTSLADFGCGGVRLSGPGQNERVFFAIIVLTCAIHCLPVSADPPGTAQAEAPTPTTRSRSPRPARPRQASELYGDWAREVRDLALDPTRERHPVLDAVLALRSSQGAVEIQLPALLDASMQFAASADAIDEGHFKIFLGRDAELLYASYVALTGGKDAVLINVSRNNRQDEEMLQMYLAQAVKQANGRPIAIYDSSSSGEGTEKHIIPTLPGQKARVRVVVQQPLREEQKARGLTFAPIAQSRAFLVAVTPERSERSLLEPSQRVGTLAVIEKEMPHATTRSESLDIVGEDADGDLLVDARNDGRAGAGNRRGENRRIEPDLARGLITEIAHHASLPKTREAYLEVRDTLRDIVRFAATAPSFQVQAKIGNALALRRGDVLFEAHIRDLLESVVRNPDPPAGLVGLTAQSVGLNGVFRPSETMMQSDLAYRNANRIPDLTDEEIVARFFGGYTTSPGAEVSALDQRFAFRKLMEKRESLRPALLDELLVRALGSHDPDVRRQAGDDLVTRKVQLSPTLLGIVTERGRDPVIRDDYTTRRRILELTYGNAAGLGVAHFNAILTSLRNAAEAGDPVAKRLLADLPEIEAKPPFLAKIGDAQTAPFDRDSGALMKVFLENYTSAQGDRALAEQALHLVLAEKHHAPAVRQDLIEAMHYAIDPNVMRLPGRSEMAIRVMDHLRLAAKDGLLTPSELALFQRNLQDVEFFGFDESVHESERPTGRLLRVATDAESDVNCVFQRLSKIPR